MKDEILRLTKQLVGIPSVNTTEGEKEIGIYMEQYFREIPYFQKHPDQVIIQELKEDPLNRRNVYALLIGEKERKSDTLLFHGHMDTVGVDDYTVCKDDAFDCDRLMKHLEKIDLPEEVKKDLASGDYLFGRGACDMKSGDAVFMVLMKHLAEHPEQLAGNILLSFNPVEENLHTGIIEGCTMLLDLKERYDLTYTLAINNDYTCQMYPTDPNHYIYTGVGGKLLQCFYIQGKETHVGQCFEGFDASMVAAKLVSNINLNPAFSDGYQGEYSLPPVALKMKDLKTWYNVQTAQEALVYFNYFVHNAEMDEIIGGLLQAGEQALSETMHDMQNKYHKYCELSGKQKQELDIEHEVMTYQELTSKAASKIGEKKLAEILEKIVSEEEAKKTDKREIPIALIRKMLTLLELYQPVIVLYFAAPYCPHNTLKDEDQLVIDRLSLIAKEVEQEEKISYKICHFFPSLSDSSYLRIDDSKESLELLKSNFPQMKQLYPLPLNQIRKLNIPAVNYGVYGKDAHKWTERVNIPYSFEVLPSLLLKTVNELLR